MPLTGFDHQISWNQFRKRNSRPRGVDEDAEIHTEAPFAYMRREQNGRFVITTVNVNIRVVRAQSWVVRSAQTNRLLQHEQGHYDIQALGAREQHNRMLNLSEPALRELEAHVRELNAEIQRKVDDTNARYDRETNHSTNRTQQNSWDNRIANAKASPAGTLDNL